MANQYGYDSNNTGTKGAEDDVIDSRVERAKYVYEQVNGWIANADDKVSTSCAIFTGVFGVLTYLSEHSIGNSGSNASVQATVNQCFAWWHSCFFITSFVVLGVATVFYVAAIIPNLKPSAGAKGQGDKKRFLLFFGDIAEWDINVFGRIMRGASDDDFLVELIAEAHHNAGVCSKKMKRYKKAVVCSIVSLVLAVMSLLFNYLTYA